MGALRPHAQAAYAVTGNKWMATALGIASLLRSRGQGGVAGPLPGAQGSSPTGVPRPTPAQSASAGPATGAAPPTFLGGGGGIVQSARGTKTLLGQ